MMILILLIRYDLHSGCLSIIFSVSNRSDKLLEECPWRRRRNRRRLRWWSRRTCAHLLPWELQNYSLLLNNRRQGYVAAHQKSIPHVQRQRRSLSKMVGGVKSHLESKPIPSRDARRAQTKPCVHEETPQRLSQTCVWMFECLLWRYKSAVDCTRAGHLGAADLDMA